MNPRAQGPLQPREEGRITVEFLPEDGPRFLGVQEPHIYALTDQLCKDGKERQAVGTHLDVQVLYVRSPYPEGRLHRGATGYDLVVMVGVTYISCRHRRMICAKITSFTAKVMHS